MFLRNVGCNSTDYTASYPRWWHSSSLYCVRSHPRDDHHSHRMRIQQNGKLWFSMSTVNECELLTPQLMLSTASVKRLSQYGPLTRVKRGCNWLSKITCLRCLPWSAWTSGGAVGFRVPILSLLLLLRFMIQSGGSQTLQVYLLCYTSLWPMLDVCYVTSQLIEISAINIEKQNEKKYLRVNWCLPDYIVSHSRRQYLHRTAGVRLIFRSVPGRERFYFSTAPRPPLGPTHPAYRIGVPGGSFPGGKEAGVWSWPLRSI
jgi:hypothetical protein